MRSLLTASALVLPESVTKDAWLLIEDGTIHSFGTRGDGLPQHDEHHDLPDVLLAPAMLDIHVHGAANHDVMEGTAEGVSHVTRFLAGRGVGAFLPTTVTAPVDDTLHALDGLATLIEKPASVEGATPLGVHLEGPFISHAKRGVHPPELLQPPSIELFDRFWQASRGTIRLMTVAPELPHALDLIKHATALGVRISLGHSDATAAETNAGVVAGGVFFFLVLLFLAVDFFLVVIPCRCTSSGSLGWAMATRFCTRTCAMSRLVPTSKVTVRLYDPSLAQVEDM